MWIFTSLFFLSHWINAEKSYCYDDCSGNGNCVDYVCQCYEGFYGEKCSFKQSTIPVLGVGPTIESQLEFNRICRQEYFDFLMIGVSSPLCTSCDKVEVGYEVFLKTVGTFVKLNDHFKYIQDISSPGNSPKTLHFYRVDASKDKMSQFVNKHNVRDLPTLLVFDSGCKPFIEYNYYHNHSNLVSYITKITDDELIMINTSDTARMYSALNVFNPYFPQAVLAFVVFPSKELMLTDYEDEFEAVQRAARAMRLQPHTLMFVVFGDMLFGTASTWYFDSPMVWITRLENRFYHKTFQEVKSDPVSIMESFLKPAIGKSILPFKHMSKNQDVHGHSLEEVRDLNTLILTKSVPVVADLSNANFHLYELNKYPMFMLFYNYTHYAKSKEIKKMRRRYASFAAEYHDQTNFVFVDSETFQEQMNNLALFMNAGDVGMAINTVKKEILHPWRFTDPLFFTKNLFNNFYAEFLHGKIDTYDDAKLKDLLATNRAPEVKSEDDDDALFDSQIDGISFVTAGVFDDIVYSSDNFDVDLLFFLFHSIDRSTRVFRKSCVRFQELGLQDLQCNVIDRRVSALPHEFIQYTEWKQNILIVLPAGDSERSQGDVQAFRVYTGEYSVSSMMLWVQKTVSNKFKLPELHQFNEEERQAYKEQIEQRELSRLAAEEEQEQKEDL